MPMLRYVEEHLRTVNLEIYWTLMKAATHEDWRRTACKLHSSTVRHKAGRRKGGEWEEEEEAAADRDISIPITPLTSSQLCNYTFQMSRVMAAHLESRKATHGRTGGLEM